MAATNGLSITADKFEGFKCDANDAVEFKLVRQEADVFDDEKVFRPEMCHQIFGDSESIFGYKDLKVQMYCSAARMTTFLDVKYSEKIKPEEYDGVKGDDIMTIMSEKLQPGFLTSKDNFIAYLNKDKTFKPFGELIHAYSSKDRQFEIYKTDIESPGFRDFHERIQPFLLFYIDAAWYIEVDDERWDYYLLFEKYKHDDTTMYAFAGYMTIYNYYAYPEKTRPRISQVLVLPPFQKQGHAATMIQAFYNNCFHRHDIRDITVEDPSENFQRVRDFVDCKNCMNLPSFHPDKLCDGFTDTMANEAREKLLINKKQSRRLYEILRLRSTNMANKEDVKAYRLDIKKRLNQPFQKKGRDVEKMKRALDANELAATLSMDEEQRMDYLNKHYEEIVTTYRSVIERLATVVD